MGEQFDKAVSLAELCKAIRLCKKGVSYKTGPVEWYVHSLTKAKSLQDDILRGAYKLRPGIKVQIYRPKRREAIAPWFRDRVWQRSMCNNGVYDDLVKSLMFDNYACQTGKGTDLAIRRTIQALQRLYRIHGTNEIWIMSRDVRKYFPSTPQAKIHELDSQKVSEPRFLPYLAEIVEGAPDLRTPEDIALDAFGKRGTGLGSQINQVHQVALLSAIDHDLRQHCEFSQRYMDDFQAMDVDKQNCIKAGELIDTRLLEFGLVATDKHGLKKASDGFRFLRHTFRLTNTGKVILRLHPDTIRDERRALVKLRKDLTNGTTTMEQIRAQYQSFIAIAEYCSSDGPIRAMDKLYTSLFREKPIYKRKKRYFYGNRQNSIPTAPGGQAGKRASESTARDRERKNGVSGAPDSRH